MLGPTLDAGTLANGKTVRLVPTQGSHLDACIRWLNDPRVTRYLTATFGFNRAMEDQWYSSMTAEKSAVNWAIEVDNVHVGQTGIEDIDWLCRTGSTGIMIGEPQYWNQGIATAVMRARTDFAFNRLNLVALYTEVFTPNAGSLTATQRVGYREYGRRPYARFIDGEYVDAWLGVMTREAWENATSVEFPVATSAGARAPAFVAAENEQRGSSWVSETQSTDAALTNATLSGRSRTEYGDRR